MNRAYRLIWQEATRTWVAVAENVRGRRKGSRAIALVLSLAATSAFAGVDPNALPTGYKLIAGESDAPKMVGNEMVIDQKSLRAVYGWDSFDIGSNASVYYKQISSSAVAMNLIGGNEASQIFGRLRADGQLFLMNQHGVVFAPGSQIDVGGMLATTMRMDADEFMNGNYRLEGAGGGKIRNEGLLKAVGSIALVGDTVENAGTITAASVTLAAGSKVAIDLTGDGLIRARVENPALRARLENTSTGKITATLSVAMTAGDAKSALDSIVNNTGTIRATGLVERGGEILLEGTVVMNNGTLDASSTTGAGGRIDLAAVDIELGSKSVIDVTGTSGGRIAIMGDMKKGRVRVDGLLKAAATGSKATDDGGFIETSAAYVGIARGFRVDARSAHGRTGEWLIDPLDFYITAGSGDGTASGIGADTLSAALAGANMTLATSGGEGTGNLYVDGIVRWSANTLTLSAHRNIYVRKDLVGSGTAKLALKYGMDSADGNGADYYLQNGAKIYLPAGNNFSTWSGTMQEGPTTYTVVTSLGDEGDTTMTTLQGMANRLNGRFVLGADIDASSTASWNGGAGFNPIGQAGNEFTGQLHGLGHTISGLTINRPNDNNVGLFGNVVWSTIRNVGLVDVDIQGASQIGAFAGYFQDATLRDSYATGRVRSSGAYHSIGGLIGYLDQWDGIPGLVVDSFADVAVSSTGGSAVGGLVGTNWGGKLLRTYASGAVSGATNVGGLVGSNASGYVDAGGDAAGTIVDSYATGAVSGTANFARVGGLVGYLSVGKISRSYATGAVSSSGANGLLGGLVGVVGPAGYSTISYSFWDTATSGQSACNSGGSVYNCTGLATADMKDANTYFTAEWNIADDDRADATWRIYDGRTYPFLVNVPVRAVAATPASETSAGGTARSGTEEVSAVVSSVTSTTNRTGTELRVDSSVGQLPDSGSGETDSAATRSAAGASTLVVADSKVEKPADDIVARGGKKGRALVCRGG